MTGKKIAKLVLIGSIITFVSAKAVVKAETPVVPDLKTV